MNKQSTFSVAHLRMHTDELVAAVHGSHEVLVIADNGAPKAVLQDIRAFQSLQRAVNILEKLVADRADGIEEQRAEINDVLEQLRVIH